ncbi:MAG: methylated-DNA--[protein]-cysteine S-methyltransferase [Pseudomonadota bacterium]
MYYYIFLAKFGTIAILFKKNPTRIKRIFLPQDDKKNLKQLVRSAGGIKNGISPVVTDLKQKIQAYFRGKPLECDWDILDLSNLTALQKKVLCETAAIPYGLVRSYGELAERVGHPKAARFVGATMARNPFPIVIPCHRVIGSQGKLGGYSGGVELKRRLLQFEGVSGFK